MRLPHPLLLLLAGVALAASLTWVLPAGEFDRRDDPATGRRIVVAGTYHVVSAAPVGPFAAATAVPRGLVAAADVIAVILFVGGAWVVVERCGALSAVIGALVHALGRNRPLAIVCVASFFGVMGALENMQEEIIALVPVLLVFGERLGIDGVSVVSMSAGAAMIGSAFGPTNPFQAGIALKLAQEPPLAGGGIRLAMFAVGMTLWILSTIRHTNTTPVRRLVQDAAASEPFHPRHVAALAAMLLPMAFYVYGAGVWNWGFNELSAGFIIGGFAAGLIEGIGLGRTAVLYLEGAQAMIPAAILVGVSRSISIVLEDGHVVDTILSALATPLGHLPAAVTASLMVPFHALVHVAVPSISGQAVLTMPLMVPLSDVLHLPRQVAVLAYQTGGGLMELLTPSNGALMAILLAAGVPYQRWLRFAGLATAVQLLVGLAGMAAAMLLAG
jgi:uncharacterized ion transporter superfamily protein YfcC